MLVGIWRAVARSRSNTRSSGRSLTEIRAPQSTGSTGSITCEGTAPADIKEASIRRFSKVDSERPWCRATAANRSLVSAVTRAAMRDSVTIDANCEPIAADRLSSKHIESAHKRRHSNAAGGHHIAVNPPIMANVAIYKDCRGRDL